MHGCESSDRGGIKMKTFTNELDIICNYEAIDEKYDLYQLRSSGKYIARGSRVLDLGLNGIRAIAFDDGASIFVLALKNSIKMFELAESINDETILIKQLSSGNVKPYILAKLFLYSLANSDFEECSFGNLSGKLYLFKTEWIGKSRKRFKALNIDIKASDDNCPRITCSACTFSSIKLFKSPKILETFPRYVFSIKGSLKRTFEKDTDSYIKKASGSKKAEVPFIAFGEKDKKLCKANMLLSVIKSFNEKFNSLISLELVTKKIANKIDIKRDEMFFEKTILLLSGKTIYVSNYILESEEAETYKTLVNAIKYFLPFSEIVESSEIVKKELNIVLIHNQDYYADNELNDPYKTFDRSTPIQCVTVEDACYKGTDVIFKTIIKELQIKNEIINEHRFIIDDWKTYEYKKSWYFGVMVDNQAYFMNVLPDGTFKLVKKSSAFSAFKEDIYNSLEKVLFSFKGEDKMVVFDDAGNINLIIDTGLIPLPRYELFETDSPRGKESKGNNLCGVLDINIFDDDNLQYSVGPFGKTLNMSIPSAPHIYQVKTIEGQSKMVDILETLGVQFVKYNSFTVLPYPFKYIREWINMSSI